MNCGGDGYTAVSSPVMLSTVLLIITANGEDHWALGKIRGQQLSICITTVTKLTATFYMFIDLHRHTIFPLPFFAIIDITSTAY